MKTVFDKPRYLRLDRTLARALLISSVVALLCYLAVAKLIESDARERFATHARTGQNTISTRLKSYSDVLRGAASLFNASARITPAQLRTYEDALSIAVHFPALESINFAEYLRDAERADFERRMRAMAAAGEASIAIQPAGRRAEYAVVTMFEPKRAWYDDRGYDMLANRASAPWLLAGRDSGAMLTSGLPTAVVSKPNQPVLALRLPVYRRGMALADVSQRRAAFAGSVGIFISVPKLVKGVLDELPIQHVRMTIVDAGSAYDRQGRGGYAPRVLFDSIGTEQDPAPARASASQAFSTTVLIDFNGRQWNTTFSTPRKAMYTGFDAYFPWLALLAGLFSSLLVYALLHTLTSSRARAIKIARGMTRELRDSQSRLKLSHSELRRLAAHADQIKEGERKRIAGQIERDLGRKLLVLREEARMLALRSGQRHPRLHGRASATVQHIAATSKSVRQIIDDLRPSVLDLGLQAAIEWQVTEFRRHGPIACELLDNSEGLELDDRCATAFFRILQESLSNVVRHSGARSATVALTLRDGRVTMTVSDDGVGMAAGAGVRTGAFGLVGIEERITMLGGTFAVTTAPGAGTTVSVSVPVSEHAAQSPATDSAGPAMS